jgi:hypothetical protein
MKTLVLTVLLLAVASPAFAKDKYIWCWSAPLRAGSGKMFYTSVFSADLSKMQDIKVAFERYMDRNHHDDNTGPAMCGSYDTRNAAEDSMDTSHRNDKFNQVQSIDTGWSYQP